MGIPAGVAAHHPATAAVALEALADGGTAADAAVAATIASCVAETTMTGLAGGGHAITWDAASSRAETWDFFVAVPGLGGGAPGVGATSQVDVVFEAEPVPYTIGIGSCGVPGVPAGCDALWRAHGRLPWPRLVEPAVRLAREGVPLPPTHATVLAMLAPVMTMREGAAVYAPGGRLLAAGEPLRQPDLGNALELLRDEGAATFTHGTVARALLDLMRERGGAIEQADLDAYWVRRAAPASTRFAGAQVLARRDLSGMLTALDRLPPMGGLRPGDRALALVAALGGGDAPGHTTNVAVVDREGSACAVTTSLGLGTGDFLPGLGVHLNSMLGETDLLRDPLKPGARMASNMVPTLALDGGAVAVAVGAAGGTRIRSAMVQVLSGLLAEGLGPVEAVEAPRLHPVLPVVHTEPGYDTSAVAALETSGYDVRRWRTRHHYFGGVSLVGVGGPAADSRRDGTAVRL